MQTIENQESIGLAWLEDDGVLTLMINVEIAGRNDVYFEEIQPSEGRFMRMIDHLGGLGFGENKAIPPYEAYEVDGEEYYRTPTLEFSCAVEYDY